MNNFVYSSKDTGSCPFGGTKLELTGLPSYYLLDLKHIKHTINIKFDMVAKAISKRNPEKIIAGIFNFPQNTVLRFPKEDGTTGSVTVQANSELILFSDNSVECMVVKKEQKEVDGNLANVPSYVKEVISHNNGCFICASDGVQKTIVANVFPARQTRGGDFIEDMLKKIIRTPVGCFSHHYELTGG